MEKYKSFYYQRQVLPQEFEGVTLWKLNEEKDRFLTFLKGLTT